MAGATPLGIRAVAFLVRAGAAQLGIAETADAAHARNSAPVRSKLGQPMPARPVLSSFAQSHTRIGHTYLSLHGSGSACREACRWSSTLVPRPPRQVAGCPPDLPAAAISLRPAPSELDLPWLFTGPNV